MKNKRYYIVVIIGFVSGILFYMFDLTISNSETSSVDPSLEELLKNPDYLSALLYGLIGAGILFFFILLIRRFQKKHFIQ